LLDANKKQEELDSIQHQLAKAQRKDSISLGRCSQFESPTGKGN
jgi:hypothetical protein